MHSKPDNQEPSPTVSSAARDILIATAAGVTTVLIGARFNLGERLLRVLGDAEYLQLDEWPLALLVAMLAMLWFVSRRMRVTAEALSAAERSEHELALALAENRRLAQEYVRVQESERRATARDLHDELGQYLTAVKLAAIALRSTPCAADVRSQEAIDSIIRNTDHVTRTVSGLIRRLRPVALDELGLEAALEHGIAEWRVARPALEIELKCTGDLADLGEDLNLTVYRVVQESVTNVIKHATATRVLIAVVRDPGALTVTVENDGTGRDQAADHGGFGLNGMRERAAALGGTLLAGSRREGGFGVQMTVPLPATGSRR